MSKMLELFVLHLLNESHCELFKGRCLHIPVEEILKDLDLKTVYLNKNIPAPVYLKVLQQTVPKHSRVHKFTIPISASCNSHITGRIMGHKMFFVARAPPTMRDEGEREKKLFTCRRAARDNPSPIDHYYYYHMCAGGGKSAKRGS